MPSKSLMQWRTQQLPRLAELEQQCAATLAMAPVPALAEENLRGLVLLLSAHFQGFCRDLHTECVQAIAAVVSQATTSYLGYAVQEQSRAVRGLDSGNARYETIKIDFDRFGLDLTAELDKVPSNKQRITHLGHLSTWRNYVAHQKPVAPQHAGVMDLPSVHLWIGSCDEFAGELDRILYDYLQMITGTPPW